MNVVYTVHMHDCTAKFNNWKAAIIQAYLDSCSTYMPVEVYENDELIATVKAKPPA